ncbi:hypothetical protein PS9374_05926 [Planomonospora sphaerica]|uniref:Uncharacterized protein n=1 Tax=Planomonospora sphaerica TaxID=161355 RepID=A0A161LRH6_9ACTN|nr:hypothetical protein PS9374_05926 [Planomonospora sphaerica]
MGGGDRLPVTVQRVGLWERTPMVVGAETLLPDNVLALTFGPAERHDLLR